MNTEIEILLECLIDELRHSGSEPSELTIEIISKYENKYDFIKEYFAELNNPND